MFFNIDDDDEYTKETVKRGREIYQKDVHLGILKCVKTTVNYERQRKEWLSTKWEPRERTFFDCNYGDDKTAWAHQATFNKYSDDDIARNMHVKSIPFKNEDYKKFYDSVTTTEKEYVYMKLVWNEERK